MTGAAVHAVGAMQGEPRAGVGESQLAISRRDCCCWGDGAIWSWSLNNALPMKAPEATKTMRAEVVEMARAGTTACHFGLASILLCRLS